MIAERIKSYVDEKGIKQVAIANALGMNKPAVSSMLKGKRKLSAEEYVTLCDFLEVPYTKFIEKPEQGKQDSA